MTWIFIPSNYAPAAECSPKESELPLGETYAPWLTLSGKATQRPLSHRVWRTRPWIARLSGMTFTPSQAQSLCESWADSVRSSSVVATHASRSVAPVNVVGNLIQGIYGRLLLDSLGKLNRMCVFSRTSRGIFLLDSTPSPETCKEWATELRRGSLRRRKLVQRTEGNGCLSSRFEAASSWMTPLAGIPGSRRNGNGAVLNQQCQEWQTPTRPIGGAKTRGGERSGELLLNGQAEQWPTPASRDFKGAPSEDAMTRKDGKRRDSLDAFAVNDFLPPAQQPVNGQKSSQPTPRLNPRFVEWLMGWPPGWTLTDCALPETEWSRWQQLMRSSLCGLLCTAVTRA